MKRDFLESLGLETQTINSIMAVHGQTVNSLNQQVSDLEKEKEQLNAHLSQRDEQLESLKSVNADDLQNQIKALQDENENLKTQHEADLIEQKRTHKLEMLANTIGVVDDAKEFVMYKLNDLKFEEGELVGAEEAVKQLKESNPSLFKAEETGKPKWSTGGMSTVGEATKKTKEEILQVKDPIERQRLIEENMDLFQKK